MRIVTLSQQGTVKKPWMPLEKVAAAALALATDVQAIATVRQICLKVPRRGAGQVLRGKIIVSIRCSLVLLLLKAVVVVAENVVDTSKGIDRQ